MLIFLRPFLSEYAFLTIGLWYISSLILFSIIYLVLSNNIFLFSPYMNLSVFLFIIAIFVSIIFSGFTGWSLLELYFFIPNLLIFYIVSKIKPEQKKELISIIFLAAVIISTYALYQYFIGFGHLSEYIKRTCSNISMPDFLEGKRVFATFISPNIFAGYLVMMLFLGMGFLTSFYPRRTICWISIPIIAISLLLTKSLGGILSFIITFLLFIFYLIFYLLPNFGFKKNTLRIASLSITLGLFIFIFLSSFFIWHRLPNLFNPSNPNNSIVQRFYYWKASLNMIKDSPLTGVGWRKFGALYEFYKPPLANISHYSHNVFLQIMAEAGLLGLLVFLWIIFLFFQRGISVIKSNDEQQGLRIGLFCAGCAFLFHSLIDLSFYFDQASFFWWIILGFFA